MRSQPPVRVGEKHNRLTILREVDTLDGHRRVDCRCDCGNYAYVTLSAVRLGGTRSCGCLQAETRRQNGRNQRTHGGTGTPELKSWDSMMRRCFDSKNGAYDKYGGRGITVCERWRQFENFRADMGPRPTSEHSLDRIDNNGNYEPNNCRWATAKQQSNNRRYNRLLTFNGRTQTITQWCEETGVPYVTLNKRLRRGVPIERALMREYILPPHCLKGHPSPLKGRKRGASA